MYRSTTIRLMALYGTPNVSYKPVVDNIRDQVHITSGIPRILRHFCLSFCIRFNMKTPINLSFHTVLAGCLCSQRMALAVIAFLAFFNLYVMRGNLSVGIVCMVNHTVQDDDTSVNMTLVAISQGCMKNEDNDTSTNREVS